MFNKFEKNRLAKAIYLTISIVLLASCQRSDYVNVIPEDSMMLMAMDPAEMSGVKSPLILRTVLSLSNIDDTGLDLSEKVFFFEDARGNLGICAKVGSESKLKETVAKANMKLIEKRGYSFAALSSGWVLGFSESAALLMGPALPSQQQEFMRIMSRYLAQTEDDGIKGTPMFDRLDSIDAPMAVVAETKALPEKFIAPFTIGAPKDTDPADIVLAAKMSVKGARLMIEGRTMSFKKTVNKALEEAYKTYRPIEGRYVRSMAKDAALGMFLNVDGQHFHQLITQNRAVTAMLAGINAAIDMDNILKSVDGDMALVSSSFASDQPLLSMAAKLKNAPWLDDVDYWKKSVPAGGKIGDWGKDCYYYKGGGTSFYFGVTGDMQFMSGSSEQEALASIKTCAEPIGRDLQQMIVGQKLVLIANFNALEGDKAGAVTSLLKPMFGNIDAIVYTLK